jgi:hypothetical protein
MIIKLKEQSTPVLFWATAILILLLVVSCQGQIEPTPDSAGVLNGVPSIGEALGTIFPTPPPLPTTNPEIVAFGKGVYDQYCAVCHGVNLEGEADWKTPNVAADRCIGLQTSFSKTTIWSMKNIYRHLIILAGPVW